MKKQFWNSIVVLFLMAIIVSNGVAAPHLNEKHSFIQPDGSYVPVIVNGDEFYQRVEDLDGYTLIRDAEGWICYAELNSDSSDFVPQERYTGEARTVRTNTSRHLELKSDAIRDKAMEVRKAYHGDEVTRDGSLRWLVPVKVTGERVGITILIEFSDQAAIVSKNEVESMLNGESGATAKNFFTTVSGGKLTYTNQVVGYYRAKNPKSYYDTNQSGGRTRELLKEALDWLDRSGFDFSSVSSTNKTLTAVNFYYAGAPSHGWAKGLWPHMSSYSWTGANSGYKTSTYQITGLNNTSKNIGTFCHENGHMLLRYPDLYPYDQGTNWVGKYCLMSSGGHGSTPMPPNPYFRRESGWLTCDDITNVDNATISMTSNDPNRAIIYKNSSDSRQFFILESIQKTGQYAYYAPGSGMVCWKINTDGENTQSSNNNPQIVVAGGTGTGALMSNRPNTAFSSTTTPKASWIKGGSASILLKKLSASGASMTFDIGNGGTIDTMYTLSTTADNGSITLSPSGPKFKKGTEVTVTAKADAGYTFEKWSGDLSGTTNPTTITMSDNKDITAIFSKVIMNTINITATNGTVKAIPEKESYQIGEEVKLIPTPANGYYFTGWGNEVTGFDDTLIVTIDGTINVDAYFHETELEESAEWGIAGGNRAIDTLLQLSFHAYGYGGGTVDTSAFRTETGIVLPYSIPKQSGEDNWPGAALASYVEQTMENARHIRIRYKCATKTNIQLLSTDTAAAPYQYALEATDEFITVDIPISAFEPTKDWGTIKPLNLKIVENIAIAPNVDVTQSGDEGVIEVSEMYLIGIKETGKESVLTAKNVAYSLDVTVAAGKMNISLPKAGNYKLQLFSVNGRLIHQVRGIAKSAGLLQVDMPTNNLATGLFVTKLTLENKTVTRMMMVQ